MPSVRESESPPAWHGGAGTYLRRHAVCAVAFSWGLCTYIPLGVLYLHLLLMLLALAISNNLRDRLRVLPQGVLVWPIIAMLCWSAVVAILGHWFPDTLTRLFHLFRVALLLVLGMLLLRNEVLAAMAGFLVASVCAALIVSVHHVWGLPNWQVWGSLLESRNNFSSANMISMAMASGIFFWLALRKSTAFDLRWLALSSALILGAVVAMHALSRNAQLVLAVLLVVAMAYRFRSFNGRMAGLACVLTLVAATWQLSPLTRDRFTRTADDLQQALGAADYGTSVGVRLRMYEEAVQGIAAHPILGTGIGSWLPHWRVVWKSISGNLPPASQREFSEVNNPHNDFLLAGMETGVPGMLLLAWLMARGLRYAWRRESCMGGVSAIVGMTVVTTAMVNAPFRDAALGMTLLWLLGASTSRTGALRHA